MWSQGWGVHGSLWLFCLTIFWKCIYCWCTYVNGVGTLTEKTKTWPYQQKNMFQHRDFEVLIGPQYCQIPYEGFVRYPGRFWDFIFFDYLVDFHENTFLAFLTLSYDVLTKSPDQKWSQELCGNFILSKKADYYCNLQSKVRFLQVAPQVMFTA